MIRVVKTLFACAVSALLIRPSLAPAAPVHGDVAALRGTFQALQTSRVDFVGLGDSNQLYGGYGWDHGLGYALATRAPQYATSLHSWRENNGNGAGQGYGSSSNGGDGSSVGAPTALAAYLDKGSGSLYPSNYGFGNIGAFGFNNISVEPNGPLGSGGPLTGEFHYGTFESGTHDFNPSAHAQGPYSLLASGSVNATTGSYGMARYDLAVPADPARAGREVQFRPNTFGAAGATDAFLLYGRVSRPDRAAGWSSHTLDGRGGQPTSALADDLRQASDQTLSYYFAQIRRLQGEAKRVVITINGGQNDAGDATPSRGPLAAPGNTGAGRRDNLAAIVARIKQIWTVNGWDQAELNWVLVGTHPMSGQAEAANATFRAADREFAESLPGAVAVDLTELTSFGEMLERGWYQANGSDTAHLTQAGYEQLSLRVAEAVAEAVAVPEPETLALEGLALTGLLARRRSTPSRFAA